MEDYDRLAPDFFESRIQETLASTFTEGLSDDIKNASIKEARIRYDGLIQNGHDPEIAIKSVTANFSNYLAGVDLKGKTWTNDPFIITIVVIAILFLTCFVVGLLPPT